MVSSCTSTFLQAKQQGNYLKKFLDADIGIYIGADVELWSGDIWTAEFAAHNVLVMTPQVGLGRKLVNWLSQKLVNLRFRQ